MTMTSVPDIWQYSYHLSLLLGAIMIAVFAWRRLELISADLTAEFMPLLQEMTTSKVLGRKQYNQAYALYALPLLLIYGILCLSQPVAGHLLGFGADEVWATEATPFMAAAFIVALGPNAGWLDSLESGIRRFAQRLAGIPEDLFDLVNVIKRFDLLDPDNSRSLSPEGLRNSARIADAAGLMGLDPNETLIRRNIVTCQTLHSWVVSEGGGVSWSEAVRVRFSNTTAKLTKDMRRLRLDGTALLKDTLETQLAKDIGKRTATAEGVSAPDDAESLHTLRARHASANAELLERWEDYREHVATTAKNYCLIFALYAINDKHPVFDPRQRPALAELLEAVWRPRINRTLDRAGVAIVAGLAFAFVAVMLWKVARAIARGDLIGQMAVPIHQLARDAAYFGWTNALGTFSTLIAPVVLAVFVRACKKSDRTWAGMVDESGRYPFIQSVRIVVYSIAVSLVLTAGWALLYELVSGDAQSKLLSAGIEVGKGEAALKQFFSIYWGDKAAISAAGGILACVLCYILDREEKSKFVVSHVAILAATVGCLLALYVSVAHVGLWDPAQFTAFTQSKEHLYTIKTYDALVQDVLVFAVFSGAFLVTFTFPSKQGRQPPPTNGSDGSIAPFRHQRPELVYSASATVDGNGVEATPPGAAART